MFTFEIGKKYFDTSACDHTCVFVIEITKRTAKTVTFLRNGKERRAKIHADDQGEFIIPDRYSMAPVFRASREYVEAPVEEVRRAEAAIREMKDAIFRLKGVQICPACGAELPAGGAFCNSCGAKLPEPPKPVFPSCPACGAPVEPDTVFCTNCGVKLPEPVPAPEPAPAPMPAPEPAPAPMPTPMPRTTAGPGGQIPG